MYFGFGFVHCEPPLCPQVPDQYHFDSDHHISNLCLLVLVNLLMYAAHDRGICACVYLGYRHILIALVKSVFVSLHGAQFWHIGSL